MRLDVVCFLALAVAFWYGACKFISIREDDFLGCSRLHQAMVYCLSHGSWARILALDNILPCRFLKRPDYRLRRCSLYLLWYWIDAVAVHRYDDKVMLFLRFLRYRKAEDLIYILPCNSKFHIAIGAYRSYAAILAVQELECEFLALRNGETDAWVRTPCFGRRAN